MEKRQSDLGLLLPSFRARVELLLARLTARGFDPVVFETLRSQARAAMLGKTGPGIADSIHCYGAACDIISKSRAWQWPEFYVAMRDEAEALGLTAGYRFPKVDADHVQGVRVSAQALFRSLKPEDRDAFVRVAMGPLRQKP